VVGSSNRCTLLSDVSWGTKGDNKVGTDLGVVAAPGKTGQVDVAVPTEQKDINAAYEDAIAVLNSKPPKEDQKRDASTKQEDYYRQFRTKWVTAHRLLVITKLTFLFTA
jgi:chitin synthase